MFAELFDEMVQQGSLAVQTQHPGFYYQLAAKHASDRRVIAFQLCSVSLEWHIFMTVINFALLMNLKNLLKISVSVILLLKIVKFLNSKPYKGNYYLTIIDFFRAHC